MSNSTYSLLDTILELSAAFNCSNGQDTETMIDQAKQLQLAWNTKLNRTQPEYNAMIELVRSLPEESEIKKILTSQMA